MVSITVPTRGQEPYDVTLNTALNTLAAAIPADIVTDAALDTSVTSLIEDPASDAAVALNATIGVVAAAAVAPLELSSARGLVPLGSRARTPYNSAGNTPSTVQSNGTNLGGTFRMTDIAQVSGAGVVLVFSNFINNGTGEVDNGDDYTIDSCTIELGTDQKNIPVLFGGSRSIVVKDGLFVFSDPVGIAIRKGQQFSVRTDVSVASGDKYPIHLVARGDPWGEGFSGDASVAGPGTDLTGFSATWVAVSGNKLNTRMCGPSAVLVRPQAPTAVLLGIGDSIIAGTGEGVTFTGFIPASADRLDMGWVARACESRWPAFIAGLSGTALSNWNSSGGSGNYHRRNVIEQMQITHVLNQDGINDLQGGAALATVQSRAITAWRDRATWGRPQYQSTITPLATTSSDNWTTVAGQTLHGNAAVRVTYNAWLRDGAPMHLSGGTWIVDAVGATGDHVARAPYWTNTGGVASATEATGNVAHLLSGIIEVSDAIESTRDSGRFGISLGARVVSDANYRTGAATLTSATAAFTDTDIGRPIVIVGAGPASGNSSRLIVSRQSGTQVTLDANASTAVTGAVARIGAYGTCADGVHPSGSTAAVKGGHELMADYVRPILAEILGPDSI